MGNLSPDFKPDIDKIIEEVVAETEKQNFDGDVINPGYTEAATYAAELAVVLVLDPAYQKPVPKPEDKIAQEHPWLEEGSDPWFTNREELPASDDTESHSNEGDIIW